MQNEHTLPCLTAFEEHHNDLLRFFTHKLGCRDLAADCTQAPRPHEAFNRCAKPASLPVSGRGQSRGRQSAKTSHPSGGAQHRTAP